MCDVSIDYENQQQLVKTGTTLTTKAVAYNGSYTHHITNVSPNFGSIKGGDTITFKLNTAVSAASFTAAAALISITFDGVPCTSVTYHATTGASPVYTVTCVTGAKVTEVEHSSKFFISGRGLVSWGGSDFNYVRLWSEISTWGQEAIPQAGESVYIPKGMNVLFNL